jgi:hypothetical protein
MNKTAFRILCYGVFVFLASGCGPAQYKVKGKIVRDGVPAMPEKKTYYQVSFYPFGPDGKLLQDVYPANRGKEFNSFSVPGKTGKGIPPGKYRIGIRMTNDLGDKDNLQGAFGRDNSPIIREVNGSEEMIIDLAKP